MGHLLDYGHSLLSVRALHLRGFFHGTAFVDGPTHGTLVGLLVASADGADFHPPSAARSTSEMCFRSVANFRRRLCQPHRASWSRPASTSAALHHFANVDRARGCAGLRGSVKITTSDISGGTRARFGRQRKSCRRVAIKESTAVTVTGERCPS